MKYCEKCSSVLRDLDNFCGNCGVSVYLKPKNHNSTDNMSYNQNTSYIHKIPLENYEFNSYQIQEKNPGQPWLIASIISIFCFGGLLTVPALILSIQSMQSFAYGNIDDSFSKAKTAEKLFIISIGISILFAIIYFSYKL